MIAFLLNLCIQCASYIALGMDSALNLESLPVTLSKTLGDYFLLSINQ